MHEKLTPMWLDELLEGVAVTGSSPIEDGFVHRLSSFLRGYLCRY